MVRETAADAENSVEPIKKTEESKDQTNSESKTELKQSDIDEFPFSDEIDENRNKR